MRVVVLGAGFGGLEVTARLSETLGAGVETTLIDANDSFVFGFSKLDVMFGRALPTEVRHAYRDIVKPGVRFVQAAITAIDPVKRHVVTDAGEFDADVLVIALGADLDPAATPGLVEGGHEFYTVSGAFAVREVLASFAGGHVVVGVTSAPFKCPPAPSETVLLLDELFVRRGMREQVEISLVMPFQVPIPPSPQASEALLSEFSARRIAWHGERAVVAMDPTRRIVELSDGTELACDLFLGVPVHRAPRVVVEAGLTVDGWVPVDPYSLATSFPDVFAVGDVTSVGTPKAGVFAEGQAAIVADAVVARARGDEQRTLYDGRGICYLEFGDGLVGRVDVAFRPGQPASGTLDGPSRELAADKVAFGADRIQRWFDTARTTGSHSTR